MKFIFLFFLLILPFKVSAEDWVTIENMSLLKWQMAPNGVVYLRNLNEFNPQALPCCYNYSIDTTTEAGKSIWSVVLTKMATSEKLILGVSKINQAGPVTYLGIW
jgi:hypothetical protein